MSDEVRAIERLLLSYATHADGGRPDLLPGLFAGDGEIRAAGRTFAGAERIAKFFGAATSDVHATKHVLTNIAVDLDGPDAATSVTYFQVLRVSGLQAWGRYVDQLSRSDGQWKIVVREVLVDGHVAAS